MVNKLIALTGLLLGILVGFFIPIHIPSAFSAYFSIAVLAALDSVFGGFRAAMEKKFDYLIFISGFLSNALLAAFLAYFGDRMGIPIYLAAVFAFGVRLFENLAIIRRYYLSRILECNKNFMKKKGN